MDTHILAIPILIYFIFLISVLIPLERSTYKKLKLDLQKPFNNNDDSTMEILFTSYTDLYYKNPQKFKVSLLNLKTLKEGYSNTSSFDDIPKLIISVIPMLAIVMTISTAAYKDLTSVLLIFQDSTVKYIFSIIAFLILTSFSSFISKFAHSKSVLLINRHLVIAEDVEKNPHVSKIYLP